jgi:hypothetical protein
LHFHAQSETLKLILRSLKLSGAACDLNLEDITSDGNRSTSRILSLLSGNAEPDAVCTIGAPPLSSSSRQNRPKTMREEASNNIKFEDDEIPSEQAEEELTKSVFMRFK